MPLTIWKISHGKNNFSPEDRQEYLERKVVLVHSLTGKGQGNAFTNEVKIGDYFYLCHGNDVGIVLFGRILSEATKVRGDEEWNERQYKVIKNLKLPKQYHGDIKKGWTPNFNSTISKVKSDDMPLFEKHILKKYFGLTRSILTGFVQSQEKEGVASKLSDSTPDLNAIYYGPPGTGKTYKLLTKIAKTKFLDQAAVKTDEERAIDLVESNNLSWWEAAVLSLLDLKQPTKVPSLVEHPIMKARIATSSSKHIRNIITIQMSRYTKADCTNVNSSRATGLLLFWKDEQSFWSIDDESIKIDAPEFYKLLETYKKDDEETENIRYVFTTFHQSFSYEDFVEGIKPVMDESTDSGLTYQIEDGIFKRIAAKAKANPKKEYAIFIDEINRGNVASIFGELITLIEPDKRLGAAHEVIVTLPYSKERFGVPPNLHIYGTMNTADRSIVALDSALRRRFNFEECFPDLTLIKQPNDLSVDLRKLLKRINQRITMLIDRDHAIGHSYFIDIINKTKPLETLRDVFRHSIIPLLEEYFAGDLERVGMVLGERFVKRVEAQSIPAAPGSWDSSTETKDVYTLEDLSNLSEEAFKSIYAEKST